MRTKDNNIFRIIKEEILNNNEITEVELANICNCNERTIRRYIKILKDNNILKLEKNGKERKWIII